MLLSAGWMRLMRRGLRTSPEVIATRAVQRVRKHCDRSSWAWRTGTVSAERVLQRLHATTLDELWTRLANRPFATPMAAAAASLEELCPGSVERILAAAARAHDHQVDLLGTGPISIGDPIDWHRDFKVGQTWPLNYFATIDCCQLDQPSDVKIPWEISRLQWLIPVGQAYVLTQDESHAETARNILQDWIDHNPCLYGVNWACTMEPALRIIVWTWLFHVFHASSSWQAADFRAAFLTTLFAHAEFTDRYLEITDINGNHCTADAAALVFAGLFFGFGEEPRRWRRRGWNILTREITRQVSTDGVDFEGSIPYHRLVCELFLWPALYRMRTGHEVPSAYRSRLLDMAKFTLAYTRPDGGAPNWGDGDDARVLPFSQESLTDHRYLPAVLGLLFDRLELVCEKPGPLDEVYWMMGQDAARQVNALRMSPPPSPRSISFPAGGYFVLQNARDHVLIDCGPVGLAGRGGHGHNDCLSLEATLNGVRLFVDPGSYVYTASHVERDRFRSTAFHNTPIVAGEEINRFLGPRTIWALGNDARPIVHRWQPGETTDEFHGGHTGYQRWNAPVEIRREVRLSHAEHRLEIQDHFRGLGERTVEIPLHLAPGIHVRQIEPTEVLLTADDQDFRLSWTSDSDWNFQQQSTWISPSYGRKEPAVRLSWTGTERSGSFRLAVIPLSESSRWQESAGVRP